MRAPLRCLDADGQGRLSLHEVNFLDDWDLGQAEVRERSESRSMSKRPKPSSVSTFEARSMPLINDRF